MRTFTIKTTHKTITLILILLSFLFLQSCMNNQEK